MWLWCFFFTLMIISSWNVNSVRARIENILSYIKDSKPDILLLQEIKTQEAIAQNQYNQQDFSERDSSKESGGSYGGGEEDRPVIKPKKPSGGTTLGSSEGLASGNCLTNFKA